MEAMDNARNAACRSDTGYTFHTLIASMLPQALIRTASVLVHSAR